MLFKTSGKRWLSILLIVVLTVFLYHSATSSKYFHRFARPIEDTDGDEEQRSIMVPLMKQTVSKRNTTKVVVFVGGKGAGHNLMRTALEKTCKIQKGRCKPLCDVMNKDVFNTGNTIQFSICSLC